MKRHRSGYSLFWLSCFALVVILSSPHCCIAQSDKMEDVAMELAGQVAAALDGVPGGTKNGIDVKTIDGRETGGPGFRHAFLSALKNKGITLTKSTKYNIDGTIRYGGEPVGETSAAASVKLSLRGPDFEQELMGRVNGESDIIALVGMTGVLPVSMDRAVIGLSAPVPGTGVEVAPNDAERKAKLAELILQPETPKVTPNPTPFIDGTGKPEVSEVHVSVYGIEILIRDAEGRIQMPDGTRYRPRPPIKDENGELFVAIHPGEIYAIKLINDSKDYDAGVKLTIDGLDSFLFSEEVGYKKLGMWIIPHESSGIIRGWHTRNKDGQMVLAEFEVAKYGEGLAEEMGAYGDVGKITASFRAAWSPKESTPGTALAYSRVRGTKKGEEVTENMSQLKRHFGEIRAAISIRYQIAEAK